MRYRVALTALVLAFSTGVFPATAQENVLDDRQFERQLSGLLSQSRIGKAKLTQDELWAQMAQLEDRRKKAANQDEVHFVLAYSHLAETILANGTEQDYTRLLHIYRALPPAAWLHQSLLRPLSAFWITRELEQSGKTTPPSGVKLPLYEGPMPEHLQAATPELQDAWRRYKAFTTAFLAAVETPKEAGWLGVQQSWPLFYDVAGDVLEGKVGGAVPRLAQFQWGGWCGTGSDTLYEPQSRLLFMSLLRERRYAPAVGALFEMLKHPSFSYGSFDDGLWKRQFIGWCGADWEVLYAGAALDEKPTLGDLARHGSPLAARLLLQMAQLPKISERDDYLRAIAALIKPSGLPTGYGTASSADIRRVAKEAIPAEIQQQLLGVLHNKVQPDAGLDSIEVLSHILVDLARPESKAALHRIMEMPYGKARERAALALRALGEEIAPVPVRPVGFRLLQNGKAMPSTGIEWEIRMGEMGDTSSSMQTSEAGNFQLKRDYFVDAQRKITRLWFAAEPLKSPGDAWFGLQILPPANLDGITELKVETGALTLDLQPNHAPEFYVNQPILLRLHAERPLSTSLYFAPISKDLRVPFASQITFPTLQKRKYQVEIFAPGAARWQQEIALDAERKAVPVVLEPGAAVKFEIIAPGGEKRDLAVEHVLLRDGKPIASYLYYEYENRIYRGLPSGAYTLKVLSSADKKMSSAARRSAKEIAPPLQFPAYSGMQRDFVIGKDSPAVIDLGEIKLEPN